MNELTQQFLTQFEQLSQTLSLLKRHEEKLQNDQILLDQRETDLNERLTTVSEKEKNLIKDTEISKSSLAEARKSFLEVQLKKAEISKAVESINRRKLELDEREQEIKDNLVSKEEILNTKLKELNSLEAFKKELAERETIIKRQEEIDQERKEQLTYREKRLIESEARLQRLRTS